MVIHHIPKELLRKFRRILGFQLREIPSPLLHLINTEFLSPSNELMRLGTKYGGWLLPKDIALNEESVCYLAGAGEDISFDCALSEKFGSTIRIVDPTPRAIAHFHQLTIAVAKGERFPINRSTENFYTINQLQLSQIHFLPYGLAGEDVEMKFYFPQDPSHVSCSTLNLQKTDTWFNARCYKLATLMNEQGDQSLDLLKMDIEGGEYAVIDDLLSSGLLPHFLLVEFDEAHTPLDGGAMDRMKDRIHALENANMRCIALDGCNVTFQHFQ